ncbi:MAG: hypothetical protein K1000chlam4_01112 [Chlamydiae bacterium]|nr:hypothetical protein [Chlamydiota bacterium]
MVCSAQGRIYHNWYLNNCADDLKTTLKDKNLHHAREAGRLDHLVEAKTLKQITVTESYEDDDGLTRYRDMKRVIEVEDNQIQMRALEHLSDLLGSTKEAVEDMAMLIIYRVGPLAESRFKRKLREQKNNGKNGKKKTE